MAKHTAVGYPNITRNSDRTYTHVVIGNWPDYKAQGKPEGAFGWSQSEANANKTLRTWTARGAIELKVVPVVRVA